MKCVKEDIYENRLGLSVSYVGRRVFRQPQICKFDSSIFITTVPGRFNRPLGYRNPKRSMISQWKEVYRHSKSHWWGDDEV